MKIAIFSSQSYDRSALKEANRDYKYDLVFFDVRLTAETAILAQGFNVICCFVNDCIDAKTLAQLAKVGVRFIALRSAGFNHVDLKAAEAHNIRIARVPEYSPYAVAEHAFALILMLNRKIHRAFQRVRELNFTLEGLVGFDLHGKTIGVIGTGKIGKAAISIARGFGLKVMAYDIKPDHQFADRMAVKYVDLPDIYRHSDIITLHAPLTVQSHHLIDDEAFSQMKSSVLLINTSRGGLINARALIDALKQEKIGGAGLDVYEEEEGVFFRDLSESVLTDDLLARLLTFPNVVITSHQAFLTKEALHNIAEVTLENIAAFAEGRPLVNEVRSS